ncbi:hypothetical protein M0805_004391 [Coniferiporia weirii]|nr:hypothetical protein M0805_004391 [Coniferiporia weirii]
MKNTHSFGRLSGLVLLLGTGLTALANDVPTFPNSVYLIGNAEAQFGGAGLSAQGDLRANCLTTVFGAQSNRTVGYIIADPPRKDGNGTQAIDTVEPLAASRGIVVDTSCEADDKDCIAEAAITFASQSGTGILICSEREYLQDIAGALGVNDAPDWPKGRSDVIWTVIQNKLVSQTSENCPGLD